MSRSNGSNIAIIGAGIGGRQATPIPRRAFIAAAAKARLGEENIVLNHRCTGLSQDTTGVTLFFEETSSGAKLPQMRAEIALACDGINSAIRRQFYPDEELAFEGINTWRGVARHKPILGGHAYLRIGSIKTGKLVIYPTIGDVDGKGTQLVNWTSEVPLFGKPKNDWNKPGKLNDFFADLPFLAI